MLTKFLIIKKCLKSEQIKGVNKKLTSYKAVKSLELKEGEFEKTSTMKIKRYKELQKDKK